ncbi:MFS general substrate transporter [Mycena kentingensis (nom. inval.)]|nr:MFS general substrate transporter [Mycena kentingensis (nom. inval.)]
MPVSDSVIHAVAGGAAGVVSMTATYPFVFISTRAAVETKNNDKTLYETVLELVKREGLAVVYQGLSTSVYYYFYERSKEIVAKGKPRALSTPESMLIGLIAGSATTVLLNPIWVVQTSQAVEGMSTAGASPNPSGPKVVKKLSMLQTIRKLLASEDHHVRAFWRGIGPALVLVVNPILQYTVFEQLKNIIIARRTVRMRAAGVAAGAVAALTDGDVFILGALAKLVATSATYPYIVVKSRLQAGVKDAKYKSSWDGLAKIVREEGVAGLYKGIETKLVQSVLTAAFLFAGQQRIYQMTKRVREPPSHKLEYRALDPLLSHCDDYIDPDAAYGGHRARKELERQLVHKLDKRMSLLVLIYVLNYIDRNNASAARLRGFERDLGLTGTQFASLLSILYVGYLVMQIPSNMLLHYIGRPSLYLPGWLCRVVPTTALNDNRMHGSVGFAVCSNGPGLTSDFKSAMYTRFFIGFTEAAFFPGAWFLISKWYTRKELSQRQQLYYRVVYARAEWCPYLLTEVQALISNALGSLIASGILDAMEGRLGYAAWRWLFFIEGGLTVSAAILAMFILPDFPETSADWLTTAEASLARRRMIEDVGEEDLEYKADPTLGFWLAIRDPKVWWLAVTLTFIVMSLSFNAYFPTLVATMGFGTTLTLLFCAPPWFVATFAAFAISRHSDRVQERFWHLTGPLLLGMVGFLLASSTMIGFVRYISLFLMANSYSGFIVYLSWASGSLQPASKRAVALALINVVSSFGNIIGSFIFPTSWGPSYAPSFAICTFASSVGILLAFMLRGKLALLNLEAERKELEEGVETKGFRYLL